MEKIVSVKEYAEKKGISKKTAYKKINAGQLKTIKKADETGKTILYIVYQDQATEEINTAAAAPVSYVQPGNVSDSDTKTAEKDTYMLLLAEKDKQIAQLQKQLDDVTDLLRNSQKIQAGQLKLLTGKDAEETVTITQATPEDKPQKKRSFWERLTGK